MGDCKEKRFAVFGWLAELGNVRPKEWKMKKRIVLVLGLLALVAITACTVVVRKNVAVHPPYLHALSDLRLARAYLDKLTPNEEVDAREYGAIEQINAAIDEIKRAAIDDGKNLADHPPIDANLKRVNRYQKALELLEKVHRDINREEDNTYANHLKKRALEHVEKARNIVRGIVG
jgi:tetratricopeptide (TPR) repeat protein